MHEKNKLPYPVRYLISANAAVATVFLVHPFDLIKSRMQMAGMQNKTQYDSSWHSLQVVLHNEGYMGLYQGLGAAILRQFTYTATRLTMYTFLNETYRDVRKLEPNLLAHMTMGVIAGALGAVVGTPADLMLLRMTTDGQMPVDHRRNYKSVFDAVYRTVQEEGASAMWRGCMPTIVRAMLTSMTQLSAYSQFRRFYKAQFELPDGVRLFAMAATSAGLISGCASLPVDLVKTRLQSQEIINGKPEYTGALDVATKLLKSEGVLSLWSGFGPYFLRVAPATIMLFLLLEQQTKMYLNYVGE